MSDNLTTLISKVQNILGDASGTYFTTAIVTAALRQTLSEWNLRVPQFLATTITAVNNQYEYELTDDDTDALEIIDVLQQGSNQNEIDIPLIYDAYIEDERLFFRLRNPLTSSHTIIVRYTKDHTIEGLDSATESTMANRYNQALVDGGAYFSLFIRAVARVETINLSKDQSDNYRELAGYYASAFVARMLAAAQRRAPVSEPAPYAWNDEYHGWNA